MDFYKEYDKILQSADLSNKTTVADIKHFIESNTDDKFVTHLRMYNFYAELNDVKEMRFHIMLCLNFINKVNLKNQYFTFFINYIDFLLRIQKYETASEISELFISFIKEMEFDFDNDPIKYQYSFALAKLQENDRAIRVINSIENPLFLGFPEWMRVDADWTNVIKRSRHNEVFRHSIEPDRGQPQ